MSTTNYIGTIVFWCHSFGFIAIEGFRQSFFFHRSGIADHKKEVCLLDKYQCEICDISSGKHQGEKHAVNLRFIEKGKVDSPEYIRLVGTLKSWKKGMGYIETEQIEATPEIFVNTFRLLNPAVQLKDGDLLVFCPVKSVKKQSNYMALFAYPIAMEQDKAFLLKQYVDNPFFKLKSHLLERPDLAVIDRIRLEMHDNGKLTRGNTQSYLHLKSVLQNLYSRFNFLPKYDELREFADESFLLQLFLEGTISDYCYDDLRQYFLNSNLDQKKSLLPLIASDDRKKLLEDYLSWIKRYSGFQKINNEIKSYLDITHRTRELADEHSYHRLADQLMNTLSVPEIKSLWLSQYLEVPDEFIDSNFNLNDPEEISKLLSSTQESQRQLGKRLCLDFFKILRPGNIVSHYYTYLPFINKIRNIQMDLFDNRDLIHSEHLSISDQFCLWVYDALPEFYSRDWAEDDFKSLDVCIQIRAALKNPDYLSWTTNITQEKLVGFARDYAWNSLVQPCYPESEITYSFLDDVREWSKVQHQAKININELADVIYQSIPRYSVQHVRLWLSGAVPEQYLKYCDYREPFRRLSNDEKKAFRDRVDGILDLDLQKAIQLEIQPCKIFSEEGGEDKIYSARLENIYFSNKSLRLRKEDGAYTEKFKNSFVSVGLNTINKFSSLNEYEIRIHVRENKIVLVENLESVISKIIQYDILKALTTPIGRTAKEKQAVAYAEDKALKKAVHRYLGEIQSTDKEVVYINEPHVYFRRLDPSVLDPDTELVALYSIRTTDGWGIVWENADYSADRATFVFKTNQNNYSALIANLSLAISSFGQIRSTLGKEAEDNEGLFQFKNSLGHVGVVKKRRGKKEAFDTWKRQLESLLVKHIPECEVEFDEAWRKLGVESATGKINPVKKLGAEEIKSIDIGDNSRQSGTEPKNTEAGQGSVSKPIRSSQQENSQTAIEREKILMRLREVNQLFKELQNIYHERATN